MASGQVGLPKVKRVSGSECVVLRLLLPGPLSLGLSLRPRAEPHPQDAQFAAASLLGQSIRSADRLLHSRIRRVLGRIVV
jgi:hypothetical protein